MSWVESKSYCKTLGGNLIQSITAEIRKIPKINVPNAGFWIGINRISNEREFEWDDELPYTFKNWLPGQTNPDENCVEFRVDGKWNDLTCALRLPSACSLKGL